MSSSPSLLPGRLLRRPGPPKIVETFPGVQVDDSRPAEVFSGTRSCSAFTRPRCTPRVRSGAPPAACCFGRTCPIAGCSRCIRTGMSRRRVMRDPMVRTIRHPPHSEVASADAVTRQAAI